MPPQPTNARPHPRRSDLPGIPAYPHQTRGLRVLHIISELGFGGAEMTVYSLATALAARGHTVHVAGLFDLPALERDIGHELADQAVTVHRLGMRNKLDLPRLLRLVALIRRTRPDVVHTHLWHADVAGRLCCQLAGRGRPALVSTVQTAEGRPMGWRFAINRLTGVLEDASVFVSPSVMGFCARHGGLRAGRCLVIPNGIDLRHFAELPDRREVRARWAVPADALVVGTVARLEPYKAVADLVRAFAALAGRWPRAMLVIAGSGPEEASLRGQVQALGLADRVRLVGFQRDVRPVLAALDVFVLPSRWEGLPLAALEAMAAGLPVVVTNVAGSRDLIRHERTGLVVPAGDVGALAVAIERCWTDGEFAKRLGRLARQAAGAYSIDNMVTRYERLYWEVLGAGGRR